MTSFSKYLFLILFAGTLTASASAQVRFDVVPNPYAGPGLSISIGNNGYCNQPVYRPGVVMYPSQGYYPHRSGTVVVAPGYYPNNGYYNGYPVNNGYYNQGYYNQGYRNPGFGRGHGSRKKRGCR